jgi:hypothetical protein
MGFLGWFLDGGRAGDGGPVLIPILLTSLRHVNRPRSEKLPRCMQNRVPGSFLSSADALGLTVLHKTVAEAL